MVETEKKKNKEINELLMALNKAILCIIILIILPTILTSINALKSESPNYKIISVVVSTGGETTVESTNYKDVISTGIVAGRVSSLNYINRYGFTQTLLHADGQPCSIDSICEGGYCCGGGCQRSPCPKAAPAAVGGVGAGGGGGGPAPGFLPEPEPIEKEDISINPLSLQFQLTLGDSISKDIVIKNTGTTKLSFSVELEGEANYIELSDSSFTLSPDEQKFIAVKANGNKLGSYVGEIVIRAGGITKPVPFILEVESTEILFDVKLDILSQYKQVTPGKNLKMQVTLINIGAKRNVDVIVTYLIKDTKGTIIHESSETFAVEKQRSYLKEIKVPESAKPGNYISIIELRYGNSFAVSSELFSVAEKIIEAKKPADVLAKIYYTFIAISAFAIFVLYLIYKKKVLNKSRKD